MLLGSSRSSVVVILILIILNDTTEAAANTTKLPVEPDHKMASIPQKIITPNANNPQKIEPNPSPSIVVYNTII